MSNKPIYRVTISNKDGSTRDFVDYKNEDVSKKHEPLFAIFRGDDGRMFISAKEPFTYDPENEWLNIFDAQEDNSAKAKSKPEPKGKKPFKKPAKKSAPKKDPFEDDEDSCDDE